MRYKNVVYVVLVGPDGVGKTTLAAKVAEHFSNKSLNVTRAHFIGSRSNSDTNQTNDPHATSGRATFMQVLSICTRAIRARKFFFDWSKVSKQSSGILLEERGWFDQLVDPKRYRLSSQSGPFIKVISWFLPKPDLFIFSSGDPNEIFARKPELELAEISRQISGWRKLLAKSTSLELDSTGLNPSETLKLSLDEINSIRLEKAKTQVRARIFAPGRIEEWHVGRSVDEFRMLYRPQSNIRAFGLRLGFHFANKSRELGEIETDLLASVLELGVPFRSLSCIRSHNRNQWVMIVNWIDQGPQVVKFRVGYSTGFSEESDLLRIFDGKIGGVSVPKVISVSKFKNVDILRMSILQGFSGRPASAAAGLKAAIELKKSLDGLGVTHGDFTPWNLAETPELALVDWESGSLGLDPEKDLKFFLSNSVPLQSSIQQDLILKAYREA